MLKKLLCWLWGDKFMHKAYTGDVVEAIGVLGNHYTISLYKWDQSKYCTRCGKPNPYYVQQGTPQTASPKKGYRWPSLSDWLEGYQRSGKDDRGFAYPIVTNAWNAAREM